MIAVFVSIILLCSLAMPIYAYGNVGFSTDNAQLLQEENYGFSAEYATNTTSISNTAYNAILDGLRNVSSKISTSLYRIKIDEFKIAYTSIINDNPDLFYVSSSYSYTYSGDYIRSVSPMYSMSASEIENAKIIFNNGVYKALSLVDDSMSDEQKVVVIHDYLCSISRYPKDISNDQSIWHSAYGIFYNGDTVCAGYTLAFSYLMNMLGINSVYVISNQMTHAWNAVQIDGEWYYLDLTFDDLGYLGDFNISGAMVHRYFLKSEEKFSSEYCSYHNDFIKPSYVSCTSTKYDEYFWNDISTNIAVVDGDYYYLSTRSTTNRLANIVKRDMQGNEENLLKSSEEIQYTYSGLSSIATDPNGVGHTVSFNDYYARLIVKDNRFYISAMNNIYSYSPQNGLELLFKSADKATIASLYVGLGYENGNVTAQINGDNGAYTTYNRMNYINDYFKSGGKYYSYADMDNNGYINAIDYLLMKKA